MKFLVTGGAGFIGSALVRLLLETPHNSVVNVDKLTYAGNLESLAPVSAARNYAFEQVDICDQEAIRRVFTQHQPGVVIHLAAESHVDRSIDSPRDFIRTNVLGTYCLLEEGARYWQTLPARSQESFRFLHVSTDEVYGDLSPAEPQFNERSAYAPSSPYSASKAGSDHLVRAWQRTYGLPTIITNCSNNYGPYQFPEKLIPLMILNALEGISLPVYGRGDQVRDWLYVDDHAEALQLVAAHGAVGETYNVGGWNEKTNIEVVRTVCDLVEESTGVASHRLITHVADRPGHDKRYAIDASKLERDLGWRPRQTFESGLRKTVAWYLAHPDWCRRVQDGTYRRERLGLMEQEAQQ